MKAFAAEDEEREKFAKGNRDFEQIKTLGYYAMGAFNTSTRLFDGLMYLVVILAGGLSLVYGRITAGDMVAYMLYVTTPHCHHPPHRGVCRAVPARHDRHRALCRNHGHPP